MSAEQEVVIGKIGAPFGVKGWVKVHSFTEPASNITDYPLWYLKSGKNTTNTMGSNQTNKNIKVTQIKQHGKIFVAKLDGIDNKDQAHLLTNLKIYVLRSNFKDLPEGEYYWQDLIGMQVFDNNGQALGSVVELYHTGATDVIVVKGDKTEHHIPFVLDKHILEVNISANKMIVDWEFD